MAEKRVGQRRGETRAVEIEAEILRLLERRGEGKTICPSEAAKAVAGSSERAEWEPLMGAVRAVGKRLVGEGKIVVTQKGRVVEGGTAKGAIRFRSCADGGGF
jgi:hypothetical protein